MSWKTLIDSLISLPMFDDAVGSSHHEQTLKDVLEAEPAIYWYPGCGEDFAAFNQQLAHLSATGLPMVVPAAALAFSLSS